MSAWAWSRSLCSESIVRARSEWKRERIPLADRPGLTRFTCLSTGGALLALPSSVFSPFGSLSPNSQVSRGALGLLRYDGSERVAKRSDAYRVFV